MERSLLLFGSHKADEIRIISKIFDEYHVPFTIVSKITTRGLIFYHIYGQVNYTELEGIRSTLKETTERMANWGKMNYQPLK